MTDWVEIVPISGETIFRVCEKACRISNALMLPVLFTFNGINLKAEPFDKPGDLGDSYYQQHDKRRVKGEK